MSCQNCHKWLCQCNKTYGPLPTPTRIAPMPEIKPPKAESGLRPKKLVDIIRMQEILKAMQTEIEKDNMIPPVWMREFSDLVKDM